MNDVPSLRLLTKYTHQIIQCVAYCQVSVSWDYGQEISFDEIPRCGKDDCPISSSVSVAVTNTHSFTVSGDLGASLGRRSNIVASRDEPKPFSLSDIKAAFDFGSTWSHTTTNTNGSAVTLAKPAVAKGKCGYWTFVPYYVT